MKFGAVAVAGLGRADPAGPISAGPQPPPGIACPRPRDLYPRRRSSCYDYRCSQRE